MMTRMRVELKSRIESKLPASMSTSCADSDFMTPRIDRSASVWSTSRHGRVTMRSMHAIRLRAGLDPFAMLSASRTSCIPLPSDSNRRTSPSARALKSTSARTFVACSCGATTPSSRAMTSQL